MLAIDNRGDFILLSGVRSMVYFIVFVKNELFKLNISLKNFQKTLYEINLIGIHQLPSAISLIITIL